MTIARRRRTIVGRVRFYTNSIVPDLYLFINNYRPLAIYIRSVLCVWSQLFVDQPHARIRANTRSVKIKIYIYIGGEISIAILIYSRRKGNVNSINYRCSWKECFQRCIVILYAVGLNQLITDRYSVNKKEYNRVVVEESSSRNERELVRLIHRSFVGNFFED